MIDSEIKVHPAAAVFPMLSEDELADLAEDIKANGLIHPIVLDADGVLIDGRNRLAACILAGVEPEFTRLNGHDPVAFILSSNVQRRQLNKGQVAMAIVRTSGFSETTQRALEDRFKVSHSRIAYASTVEQHARDLGDLVMAGAEQLNKAYEAARARKDAQSSAEAQMGRLRAEAPDLAELVAEERMALREALDVLERRKAEKRREREAARQQLVTAVRFLGPSSGDIRAHALKFVERFDLSTDPPPDPVTVEQIERSMEFLAVVRDALAALGGPHGSPQAKPIPS